jgi:hypothetical protein
MTRGWQSSLVNSRWVWLVAVALLGAPLLAEFNTRLAVGRQLVEEEARLKREIELEQKRAEFLQGYEQFVRSDEYVEWWARVNARMVKPGEVAVVPQSPDGSTERIAPPTPPARVARDYPTEWWSVFFADLP